MIRYQNTQSLVNPRGTASANSLATDALTRAIAGINQGLQGFEKQRDARAEDAFLANIRGLNAQQLRDFDVDGAATGNRLSASSLDSLLQKRISETQAREDAAFNRERELLARREAPLREQFLSGLNGLNSAQAAEYLKNYQAPEGVSAGFMNDIFAAAQERIGGLRLNERAEQKYQQGQSDRQKRLTAESRLNAFDQLAGTITPDMIRNAGNERAFLETFRNSPEFQNLQGTAETNSASNLLSDLYNREIGLTKEEQTRQAKEQTAKNNRLKIQQNYLDRALNELGPAPKRVAPADNPKAFNDSIQKITKLGNSLNTGDAQSFLGHSNDPLGGNEGAKFARNLMTNGFKLDGNTYSPADIDGEEVYTVMEALASRNNTLSDTIWSAEELKKGIAEAIEARKAANVDYTKGRNRIQAAQNQQTKGIASISPAELISVLFGGSQ